LVQSILFFLLGFLCAGFIALLLGPPIWRRAVTLTRRRLEAALPLSRTELQAEKDRVRAEFAMQARRLEMTIASLEARQAEQKVEIARLEQKAAALDVDKAQLLHTISGLEERNGSLAAQLEEAEQNATRLQAALDDGGKTLKERDEEIRQLSHQYEEASYLASSRQIELVGRESEVDKLAAEISRLRVEIRQAEQKDKELLAQANAAREALRVEQQRAGDLGVRIERLLATVADRDETLERRERELARLRETSKLSTPERASKKAGSGKRGSAKAISGADVTLARIKADRDRLERRLAQAKGNEAESGAELRDQMAALAAEVVQMTAQREGPDSPITRLLAEKGSENSDRASLAARITSLQKADAES